MGDQLSLFAVRSSAPAPAGCPRVPGPLCRDGREGRCPGKARCEELGEMEARRLAEAANGLRCVQEERAGGPEVLAGGGCDVPLQEVPEEAVVPEVRKACDEDGADEPPAADSEGDVPEVLEEGGLTCPRLSHAPRCHDCPGSEDCETERTAAIARADAERARRRAAGEPVERWGTTAADFAGVVDQDEPMPPGSPPLGAISPFGRPPVPFELMEGFEGARRCGACGCTEADHPISFYEAGPLAGAFRCWPCARPALTRMEADGLTPEELAEPTADELVVGWGM